MITPVPGDLTPSSGPGRHQAHRWDTYIYAGKTHMHISKSERRDRHQGRWAVDLHRSLKEGNREERVAGGGGRRGHIFRLSQQGAATRQGGELWGKESQSARKAHLGSGAITAKDQADQKQRGL